MTEISQLPAPRRGAKPGYYPDPLGTGRARWWDGSGWTMRVGAVVPPDAPAGKPVAPPTKQCRHCGAQSETFEGSCPNCGRTYGTRPGVIAAIVAASCLAVILLLGGCVALIGLAVEEAGDEIDKRSITRTEFNSIEPGQSEASVRAELGKPTREKEFGQPPTRCTYYPQREDGLLGLDEYRFCFQNGGLVRKAAD